MVFFLSSRNQIFYKLDFYIIEKKKFFQTLFPPSPHQRSHIVRRRFINNPQTIIKNRHKSSFYPTIRFTRTIKPKHRRKTHPSFRRKPPNILPNKGNSRPLPIPLRSKKKFNMYFRKKFQQIKLRFY